jgi:acetyltransferase-like isoleucine patch superfamily enzyme
LNDGVFKHPLALVESDTVGPGTRIWAWAHVMRGARIGADCNVGEHCFIESGAILGDRVTVKNGVAVWDGVTVEDGVFLGPAAVLTNDRRPRSRAPGFVPQRTVLREGCTIGANATVLSGLEIGRYAMIGAGALVTRDVPDFTLVTGSPARRRGHVCACGRDVRFECDAATCPCGARLTLTSGRITLDRPA